VTEELLWVYGVVPTSATLPADLTGIAGGVVHPIVAGDLAALVSPVPRDEFAEEPLRANLNDLSWLERVARDHEAVQEQALADSTIVPLRLCTIFADADGVAAMLAREAKSLQCALDRLAGRDEWGVKLLVDGARLAAAAAPGPEQALGEGGAAYLARRRQEQRARDAARSLAAELVDDVDGTLRGLALGAVRLPPQNRELAGYSGDMVLNGAYLVDRNAVGELRAAVEDLQRRHADRGADLVLTGPWPPYNFVADSRTTQSA
jgi:hypothetical protein